MLEELYIKYERWRDTVHDPEERWYVRIGYGALILLLFVPFIVLFVVYLGAPGLPDPAEKLPKKKTGDTPTVGDAQTDIAEKIDDQVRDGRDELEEREKRVEEDVRKIDDAADWDEFFAEHDDLQ